MATHLSLEELGVTNIMDMGAIGNDPPPMDWGQDFGLSPLPAPAAPAVANTHSLRLGR